MNKPLPPAKVAAYVKALLASGLKLGEFEVRAIGNEVSVLTHAAAPAVPSQDQDEDAWDKAATKWRRSA